MSDNILKTNDAKTSYLLYQAKPSLTKQERKVWEQEIDERHREYEEAEEGSFMRRAGETKYRLTQYSDSRGFESEAALAFKAEDPATHSIIVVKTVSGLDKDSLSKPLSHVTLIGYNTESPSSTKWLGSHQDKIGSWLQFGSKNDGKLDPNKLEGEYKVSELDPDAQQALKQVAPCLPEVKSDARDAQKELIDCEIAYAMTGEIIVRAALDAKQVRAWENAPGSIVSAEEVVSKEREVLGKHTGRVAGEEGSPASSPAPSPS